MAEINHIFGAHPALAPEAEARGQNYARSVGLIGESEDARTVAIHDAVVRAYAAGAVGCSPCQACGWAKNRDPASDEEPPIVCGALNAQADAERKAAAAYLAHDQLKFRIDQAIEASARGSASDAVQAMLNILDTEGF